MKCIFCKIAKGEVPCHKLYEDEDYMAFLDIEPRNPGHSLVIPKKHHRWVWDEPDIGSYYQVVQKLALAIKKAMKTDYVISLVFGEEVPHAHVWLVPRYENDGHGEAIDLKNIKKLKDEELNAITEKIMRSIV